MKKGRENLCKAVILCFWLVVWQMLAAGIGHSILFAGPVQVIGKLMQLLVTSDFWKVLLCSTGRILSGILLAFVMGTGLGILSAFFPWLEKFLQIPVNVLQAIPVACYAVLLLIWYGSDPLTVMITFVIVFPNLYFQTMAGIRDVDESLLEMAEVYHFCPGDKALYLYRPAMHSHIRGATQSAVGNAWKAGVAAEIIGLPSWSIGERIYMAKVYLNTAELFAWTAALVCVSWIMGGLLLKLLDRVFTMPAVGKRPGGCAPPESFDRWNLQVTDLRKSYGEKSLWGEQPLNCTFRGGGTYALMAPSGAGKTTLFRILAGLETPDAGWVNWEREAPLGGTKETPDIAIAFEEKRFVENLTLEDNLKLAGISWETVKQDCLELLSEEELRKPLSQYSLGMGHRAEVLRCMLSPASVLLLDEPFNGMDETMRKKAAEFIKKRKKGRLLLCITHKREEAALLQAEILKKNWNFS